MNGLISLLFALALAGCAKPPSIPIESADGGGLVGNGGDPLPKRFELARRQAAAMVKTTKELIATDIPSRAAEVMDWYSRHHNDLAEDIEKTTRYEWRASNPNGACGYTGWTRRSPIFFSYEGCRSIQTTPDAAVQLIGESVHHFNVKDDDFTALVAVAVRAQWKHRMSDLDDNCFWLRIETPYGYAQLRGVANGPVWTGEEMLLWDGDMGQVARYNPIIDDWHIEWKVDSRAKDIYPRDFYARTRRSQPVWAGGHAVMVAWPDLKAEHEVGVALDLAHLRWEKIEGSGLPVYDLKPVAADDGVLFWNGEAAYSGLPRGKIYYPASRRWETLPSLGAPLPTLGQAKAYFGHKLYVWSHVDPAKPEPSGLSVFDLGTRKWSRLPPDSLSARRYPVLIAGGNYLLIYGGIDPSAKKNPLVKVAEPTLRDGVLFDLSTGKFLHRVQGPDPFSSYYDNEDSVYWTGDRFLFYEAPGSTVEFYDPSTDTWTQPSKRMLHPELTLERFARYGVWTGSELVIWNNQNLSGSAFYP